MAQNDRVFSKLKFDPKRDVPKGYEIKQEAQLPPMTLPGEVAQMFSDDVAQSEDCEYVRLTHQAMWIADRVIDAGVTDLELDQEGELLGLTETQLGDITEQLESMMSVLNA